MSLRCSLWLADNKWLAALHACRMDRRGGAGCFRGHGRRPLGVSSGGSRCVGSDDRSAVSGMLVKCKINSAACVRSITPQYGGGFRSSTRWSGGSASVLDKGPEASHVAARYIVVVTSAGRGAGNCQRPAGIGGIGLTAHPVSYTHLRGDWRFNRRRLSSRGAGVALDSLRVW